MYSRVLDSWITVPAWTFQASFQDLATVECCVNANEYTEYYAQTLCDTYLPALGRIPNELRNHGDHLELWVMDGDALAGGGPAYTDTGIPAHMFVHEQYASTQLYNGVLEELFLHELTHTSFPNPPEGYFCSVTADMVCISQYARQHIAREDMAESMAAWVGAVYRPDRLSDGDKNKIQYGIPHRLVFLSSQGWNMSPLDTQDTGTGSGYVFTSTGISAEILGLPLTYEASGETHNTWPVFRAKERQSVLFVDDNGYWGTAPDLAQHSVTAYNPAWPSPSDPPLYGWYFAHNGWEEDSSLHLTHYGHKLQGVSQ